MYGDEVPYYEPQERRTAALSLRVTPAIKAGVEAVAKLWTQLEVDRTGDPDAEQTVADVVNALLRVGIKGAWAECGLEAPEHGASDEELQKLVSAARKNLASRKK